MFYAVFLKINIIDYCSYTIVQESTKTHKHDQNRFLINFKNILSYILIKTQKKLS